MIAYLEAMQAGMTIMQALAWYGIASVVGTVFALVLLKGGLSE